jgi:DNA-binding Lrp family transcriptional regulator
MKEPRIGSIQKKILDEIDNNGSICISTLYNAKSLTNIRAIKIDESIDRLLERKIIKEIGFSFCRNIINYE